MSSRPPPTASTAKDRTANCLALLSDVLAQPSHAVPGPLHELVENVVSQDSGVVVGRQLIVELVRAIDQGVIVDPDVRKRVIRDTLALLQPRIVSYEEQVRVSPPVIEAPHFTHTLTLSLQVNSLRFQLAGLLETEQEYTEAARVLIAIFVDSGAR